MKWDAQQDGTIRDEYIIAVAKNETPNGLSYGMSIMFIMSLQNSLQ